MNREESITVLGIMSGTSLDGLDLALCRFHHAGGNWEYQFLQCSTLAYGTRWKQRLRAAPALSGNDLARLDVDFGRFIAEQAVRFIHEAGEKPRLIASHGHTVFHQPGNGFTLQVGNGAEIASGTGIPTVYDFRQKDIALGGQGAPLVPVGDELLFGDYDYCLNLGGFANVSYRRNGKRIAFDICPVNILLNDMAGMRGLDYDRHGELGRQGTVDTDLLEVLNSLGYYGQLPPKSLGREWLDETFRPALGGAQMRKDKSAFRTVYEHIAQQVGKTLSPGRKILVTGGGACNSFLMERILQHSQAHLVIPGDELVQFKEALVFGLLGVLRWRGEINCYASVTGASADSCTGSVCL